MSTTPQTLSDEEIDKLLGQSDLWLKMIDWTRFGVDMTRWHEPVRKFARALLLQRDQGGEAVAWRVDTNEGTDRAPHWLYEEHRERIPDCFTVQALGVINPAPKEAPQPAPTNLKQVGWYLQTGHGNYFRETLDDSLKSLEFAGKPMWRPAYVIGGEQPAQSERERFEAWLLQFWRGRGFGVMLTDAEMLVRDSDGKYRAASHQNAWEGWQAALSAPTGEAK